MKIMSLGAKIKHKSNYLMFLIMILLLGIGCVFVYSASFYQAEITYGDKFFFLKKQLFGIAVGFCCYFVFSRFDYKNFEKYSHNKPEP